MDGLAFQLAWLIPVGPFLAFVLIAAGGHRSRALSQALAIAGSVAALLLAQAVFWSTVVAPGIHEPFSVVWFSIGTEVMQTGIYIDPVAAVMLAVATLVCLVVLIYSAGYIRSEPRASRFYAYMTLFAGALLGAFVCDNLLALFLFWQLMGVCSYLLIGLRWERTAAQHHALKAFIVGKIGDSLLLLGLVLLYAHAGSLAYRDVFGAATVARLAATPFLGSLSVATVAMLLLFGGTIGRSAQLPLHVWLPDALEAPLPASALIHGSMLVSAGVYLIIRAFPLLVASQAMPAVAWVGTATALYAAFVALAQSDIRRLLAFSTIGQLGYMLAALGTGAYTASVFHLVAYALFNTLLFLAAGSVIRGMERGHVHTPGHAVPVVIDRGPLDPADMLEMGGLAFRMPVTALTFLLGSLALSGFPLVTAGFWSKQGVLSHAWIHNTPVFLALALSVGLTSFYAARQVALIFLTAPRSRAATYARENQPVLVVPLVVLAGFVTGLGWVGIPQSFPWLGRWVTGALSPFVGASLGEMGVTVAPLTSSWLPLMAGALLSVGGYAGGWWLYGRKAMPVMEDAAVDPLLGSMERLGLGWLAQALQHEFGLDTLYQALVVRPAVKLAAVLHRVDSQVVGGVVRAAAWVARGLSELFNLLEGGLTAGGVKGVAALAAAPGRGIRRLHGGHLSAHLRNAFVFVLLLLAILVAVRSV
jgi:NADH-quinone oxidoreductase subunit L